MARQVQQPKISHTAPVCLLIISVVIYKEAEELNEYFHHAARRQEVGTDLWCLNPSLAPACSIYKPHVLGHGHARGSGSFSKRTGT